MKVAEDWHALLLAHADYSFVGFAIAAVDEVVLGQVDFVLRILQLGQHVLVCDLVDVKHVFFELTHEFHIVKGVYLQLRELVIETSLADLGRLSDVRVHRELLA